MLYQCEVGRIDGQRGARRVASRRSAPEVEDLEAAPSTASQSPWSRGAGENRAGARRTHCVRRPGTGGSNGCRSSIVSAAAGDPRVAGAPGYAAAGRDRRGHRAGARIQRRRGRAIREWRPRRRLPRLKEEGRSFDRVSEVVQVEQRTSESRGHHRLGFVRTRIGSIPPTR